MESKDKANNETIIEKIKFYTAEHIKAHVSIIPTGFRNGTFESELINDKYFWFMDDKTGIPIRLFLFEIYDVTDYTSKEGKR